MLLALTRRGGKSHQTTQESKHASKANSELREQRIRTVIVVIIVVAVFGLVIIFWTAFCDSSNRDSKRVLDAKLYSATFERCYSVKARFRASQVTIYFTDEEFPGGDPHIPGFVSTPRGGFRTFTLDGEKVRDAKRIPVLDLEHKLLLTLNIVDSECPQ